MNKDQQLAADHLLTTMTSEQWDSLYAVLPITAYIWTDAEKRAYLESACELITKEDHDSQIADAKSDSYSLGYDDGVGSVDDRYQEGYDEGHDKGYDKGVESVSDRYDEGYEDGRVAGYKEASS